MITIDEFLNTDLCDYASYDGIRKCASYVDGLKNASRKVIYTVLEKNIKEKLKVLQLANKAAEFADYLHGDLSGVVTTLGASYTGANNLPLMTANGNFGTRLLPAASAPRYIFTHGTDLLFKLFKSEDLKILKNQEFEGEKIEPVHYVPTLPMLLINGANGVTTGFRQLILSRNPKNMLEYVNGVLNGESFTKAQIRKLFMPYYVGFKGKFEHDPDAETDNKYICKGVIRRTDRTTLEILEVPIDYDYKGYIKVLDKLEESKKINSYEDLCDTEKDTFHFKLKLKSADLDESTEEELLERLKLISKFTEIYYCIDEHNKMIEFKSAKDIADAFIKIKLKYMQIRKDYIINDLQYKIDLNLSKYIFVKSIVDGKLEVNNRKKELIVKDIAKIDGIIQVNESYDYLLDMKIYTLTKEKLAELANLVKELKEKLKIVKSTSETQMFLNDLAEIAEII